MNSDTGSKPTGPLRGVKVVDLTSVLMGPYCTQILGDLGADIVKIESPQGDTTRWLPIGKNAGMSGMFININRNKRGMVLNLKDPRGREILHRLVAQAQVFVHSFRPGVPESLGIDYETLRNINTRLVYQYAASYGRGGPYSRQPAIDPIIAAFAGTTAHQAGEGNLPLTETGADPIAAAGHAAATMLGIFARHRTGQGQYVESAMIVSNIYLNCEDALAYREKPLRRAVDQLQLGTGATYRLYETAPVGDGRTTEPYENPAPRWVFLAAVDDDEFARFCKVAKRDDIARDPRFTTRRGREENRPALEAALEAVFRTGTAHEWETSLLAAGVGCVMADAMSHFAFLYRDAQARAIDMMTTSEHPSFGGDYWRPAPLIGFSTTPGCVRAFCEMGEHTRTILGELGYDEAAMTQLKEAGVVAWPADPAEMAMARRLSHRASQPSVSRPDV